MTKIALITGGSRGLGKSTALHLAEKGRDIILTYHSQKEEAEKVVKAIAAKGQKAVSIQLDIIKPDGFGQFSSTVKQILEDVWDRQNFDILINNAGTGVHNDYMKTTEAEFDRMMSEHVKAPYFLSQNLLPIMNDGGRILNFSTGLTRVTAPGFSAYAIMKGAVEILSVYMAKELGARGITVNTIAPGAIETDFGGGVMRDNDDLNQHFAKLTALGRVGMPDDIGGAVAAILDDKAGWINAQRIEVSGGQSI
ncbi:MAG: short-chain dehydrogenase [Hyphomicrobiales bacterium]|nr:MAG: short-chain dehydrogenase [Hyphomicrobiales bacterium]